LGERKVGGKQIEFLPGKKKKTVSGEGRKRKKKESVPGEVGGEGYIDGYAGFQDPKAQKTVASMLLQQEKRKKRKCSGVNKKRDGGRPRGGSKKTYQSVNNRAGIYQKRGRRRMTYFKRGGRVQKKKIGGAGGSITLLE